MARKKLKETEKRQEAERLEQIQRKREKRKKSYLMLRINEGKRNPKESEGDKENWMPKTVRS